MSFTLFMHSHRLNFAIWINFFLEGVLHFILWKLEYVWKHKSCLDPQIKNYGSIDFTLTYTKYEIE